MVILFSFQCFCPPRTHLGFRWHRCQRSLRSAGLHVEQVGFLSAQIYPAGCCLLSWPSLPRRPGSGHRAGCLRRCWRSGSVCWGWWCCVWWGPSWLRLRFQYPGTVEPRPAAAGPWTFPDVSPMRMAAWPQHHKPLPSSGLMLLFKSSTVEEILQKLLDLWDSCWSSNQHNVIDLRLVHLGVSQGFFHRLKCSSEEVWAHLFKARSGDGRVEVDALVQRVDLNAGLRAGRQGSLGSLTCCPEPPQGPLVLTDVLLVLPLEFFNKWFTIRLSKSSPPRWVSPAVAFTSKMPSSMVRMDTSRCLRLGQRSGHCALKLCLCQGRRQWLQAVGSLMILRTFSPAITPASLVACLWESLK